MSEKKGRGRPAKGVLPNLQIFWEKIPPQQLLSILNSKWPNKDWSLHGNSIMGRCCINNETNNSLCISYNKRLIHCFSCQSETFMDPVSLLAYLSHLSVSETITWLVSLPELDLANTLDEATLKVVRNYNVCKEFKNKLVVGFTDLMSLYIREHPSYLSYMDPAYTYLTTGRGLSPELMVSGAPISVFPKPVHIQQFLDTSFHTKYEEYFSKYKQYYGAPIFWYNYDVETIKQFKIIKPSKDCINLYNSLTKDSTKEEYRRLFPKSNTIYVEDDTTKSLPGGFLGLNYFKRQLTNPALPQADVYITEGEFDFLSTIQTQMASGKDKEFVILATGGGASLKNLSLLKQYGVKTVWLMFDSPEQNGTDITKKVLKEPTNYKSKDDLDSYSLSYKVFNEWGRYPDRDLDDLCHELPYEVLYKLIYTDRDKTFINSYSWIRNTLESELDKFQASKNDCIAALQENPDNKNKEEIATEIENKRHDMLEHIHNEGLRSLEYIYTNLDKDMFVAWFLDKYNIDLEKSKRAIIDVNDVDGAAIALREAFNKYIIPGLCDYSKPLLSRYTAWSKAQRIEIPMVFGPREHTDLIVSQLINSSFFGWAKSVIGEDNPLLIPFSSDKMATANPVAVRERQEELVRSLLNLGLKSDLSKYKNKDALAVVGQGIHYADVADCINNNYVVLLNGVNQFLGKYGKLDGNKCDIEWTELNTLVYDNFRFMPKTKEEWSCVKDVAELNAASNISPKVLFDKILQCIDCWTFAHHDLIREYVAAWIMSIPLQVAVSCTNFVGLQGEFESGKTSLVAGLLGGNGSNNAVPNILECVYKSDDSTPASMYQRMEGSALLYSLDEAENKSDSTHSKRVMDMTEMLYSSMFNSIKVNRGTPDGSGTKDYVMQMGILMAAINLNNDPVFRSRIITLRTKKDYSHPDVAQLIRSTFSESDIARLRKEITTWGIPYIPHLLKRIPELKHLLEQCKVEGVKVTPRFRQICTLQIATMELCGLDAVTQYKKMVEYCREDLLANNTIISRCELISHALYTSVVYTKDKNDLNSPTIKASIRTLAKDQSNRDLINSSGTGVYFLPENGWIILFWPQIKYTPALLPEYKGKSPAALYEEASRNPYVVSRVSTAEHNYIVKTLGIKEVRNYTDYTVLSTKYLGLDEVNELEEPKPEKREVVSIDFNTSAFKTE